MRISDNTSVDTTTVNKSVPIPKSIETIETQKKSLSQPATTQTMGQIQSLEVSEETTVKLKEAISKMNEMLHVKNSSSKFMYHEGLEKYYVTIVDKDTEEVVREIPPRKLLDAFYEMKKMLGMIVDEKI